MRSFENWNALYKSKTRKSEHFKTTIRNKLREKKKNGFWQKKDDKILISRF